MRISQLLAVLAGLLCGAALAEEEPFTILHSFTGTTDGRFPESGLALGIGGALLGTTSFTQTVPEGGTVFRITGPAALTTLHTFTGEDGDTPNAPLVRGADNQFYGMTITGGSGDRGTIFRIAPNGTFTTLHHFQFGGPSLPRGGLILASDGNFYGTSFGGGTLGLGTVFRMTPSGTVSIVHSFLGGVEGSRPQHGVTQGPDGALYGVTPIGGAFEKGTAFKVTLDGVFTTLHTFTTDEPYSPKSRLLLASDGDFYGVTDALTEHPGSVFRMTPDGTITTLHTFTGPEGKNPYDNALIQASDGYLYGMTHLGGQGDFGVGVIYRISLDGEFQKIFSFDAAQAGIPNAALVQANDGNFYGVTSVGGTEGKGSVFRFIGPAEITELEASAAAVSPGSTVTLSWSSARATGCFASGAWTGSKPTSGSELVPVGAQGVNTFTLQCMNHYSTASESTTVIGASQDTAPAPTPAPSGGDSGGGALGWSFMLWAALATAARHRRRPVLMH